MNSKAFIVALMVLLASYVSSQTEHPKVVKTTAERLGYPADSRLLIIHADDFGMAHSINQATMRALEKKWATSASVLVPCPWFPEVVRFAQTHPDADLGVHLTLNSEWANYRWRPLSKKDASSLTDSQGYLPTDPSLVNAHVTSSDAEAEARAQIDTAIAAGIQVSHLDTHMQTFLHAKRMLKVYWKLGQEYKLPVAIGRGLGSRNSEISNEIVRIDDDTPINTEMLALDHVVLMTRNVPQSDWLRHYENMLSPLPPGTYELVVHLGYNDDELQGMAEGHVNWGAEWRQNDFDMVKSPEFQKFLEDQKFILVTWKEVAKAIPLQ